MYVYTCYCILFFCIMWFEIRFRIEVNLHSKLVWKLIWKNGKEFSSPSCAFGLLTCFSVPAQPPRSFASPAWPAHLQRPRPVLVPPLHPAQQRAPWPSTLLPRRAFPLSLADMPAPRLLSPTSGPALSAASLFTR